MKTRQKRLLLAPHDTMGVHTLCRYHFSRPVNPCACSNLNLAYSSASPTLRQQPVYLYIVIFKCPKAPPPQPASFPPTTDQPADSKRHCVPLPACLSVGEGSARCAGRAQNLEAGNLEMVPSATSSVGEGGVVEGSCVDAFSPGGGDTPGRNSLKNKVMTISNRLWEG